MAARSDEIYITGAPACACACACPTSEAFVRPPPSLFAGVKLAARDHIYARANCFDALLEHFKRVFEDGSPAKEDLGALV